MEQKRQTNIKHTQSNDNDNGNDVDNNDSPTCGIRTTRRTKRSTIASDGDNQDNGGNHINPLRKHNSKKRISPNNTHNSNNADMEQKRQTNIKHTESNDNDVDNNDSP